MDIEKLIERLNQYSQSLIAYKLGADFADACMDAATALSTLQAENEKLKAYMNDAYGTMYNMYGAGGAYCDAKILDFWQRWYGQKED